MSILSQLAQTSYDYTYTTSSSSNVDSSAIAGFIVFSFIVVIIAYVVGALLLGRIFKKAGIASWIAWVPFYNEWKLLEMGGQQGFWAVLGILPIVQWVSYVFLFIAMYNVGLKFGKSGAFVLWAIFFPIVWFIWLAVDESSWNNTLGKPSLAVEHNSPVVVPPTQKA